jgi:hypothetical protein
MNFVNKLTLIQMIKISEVTILKINNFTIQLDKSFIIIFITLVVLCLIIVITDGFFNMVPGQMG